MAEWPSAPGLLHPADRGGQHASRQDGARLDQIRVHSRMASGLPDEQARAERGFGRLKDEEVDWQRERMVASAKANLGRVIDESSTVKRPHSSLRYRSPVAFEAADGAARTA